jgi:EAL domain-containing protein (putative c-di-GMP-specific phosphodiesterase class I)/GGDEF domain-containing protein
MAIRGFAQRILRRLRADALALGPGIAAGAYFFGVEGAAVMAALGLPFAMLSALRAARQAEGAAAEAAFGIGPRDAIVAALDQAIGERTAASDTAACYAICLDRPDSLRAAYGRTGLERIQSALAARLAGVIRTGDVLRQFDDGRFAIAIVSHRRIDLETAIQIAGRMQTSLCAPVSLDGTTVHFTVSIGFCLVSRAPEATGSALLAAAELALEEAQNNDPGAIRAFTAEIGQRAQRDEGLRDQIEAALDNGEIVAFFQPQLSTDTGAVSGFEALARWMHPTRGILLPAEFLPAIQAGGLSARLNETMLAQALSALRSWDRAGHHIETVSVNFSSEDLRDATLVARLKWELDRFDLAPERLTIEVLESVVAETDHDIIVRNLTALSDLGCGIDLDDFGTGHASIAAIRRFSVKRIKIDRCFISGVDTDPGQQKIAAAILSMAEQLGLQTVGEGVETLGEHALLAQLGCTYVQGFAIARPMPLQATRDWLVRHNAKLERTPGVTGRKAV